MARSPKSPLRRGWTTGACAAAAAKSAAHALAHDRFLDPVEIHLPRGERPSFALAVAERIGEVARAGVVKDAGDDPDVTHGALIVAKLTPAARLSFRAGEGVGTVTKPGLPIPPGEPAINPAPRAMIETALREAAGHARFAVEISVPGGAEIATRTWNPRLGVEGGLSILGTTGVVRPYSCSAWIASIHRGVDVARASGLTHVVGATGSTSEAAARGLYGALPDHAYLDMGDFAGGLLKYLRKAPLARLTIAGGLAKMTKLAQGALDLHSARSQVDFARLAAWAEEAGVAPGPVAGANTALEAFAHGGAALGDAVAARARAAALARLDGRLVAVETVLVDRAGAVVARAGFQ